jgi:hypothetical protein
MGKLERKRPLETPRRRWDDAKKTDLREICCGDVEWIHLVGGLF